MNTPMAVALGLSLLLVVLAVGTAVRQCGSLRRLSHGPAVPSDDRRYLRNRAWRRILNSGLMLILAGMLSGSYLSGMEDRADGIARAAVERREAAAETGAPIEPPERPAELREFARFYFAWWLAILLVLLLVVILAFFDLWSTRKYAWQQLRRIRDEQRTLLERDLAMYKQSRQEKLRGRIRSAPAAPAPEDD